MATVLSAKDWRKLVAASMVLSIGSLYSSGGHSESTSFRKGIAIYDAMNWATLEPGSNARYTFPPFSDSQHPFSRTELSIIKANGFDFVRLAIDPGPFLQFTGSQRSASYAILEDRVQAILTSNLSVIVDIHPARQVPDYGPKAFVQGTDTPTFLAYRAMLTQIATLLAKFPTNRVALELLNEPEIGGTSLADLQWQLVQQSAYDAVRAISTNLPIVLTGGHGGDITGLLSLNIDRYKRDPNVLYTFHYYDPAEFTTQSGAERRRLALAADIPYPARARPFGESVEAISQRVKSMDSDVEGRARDMAVAIADLTRYRQSGFDRKTIHDAFASVVSWAKENDVLTNQILLGEFGVIRRTERYNGAREPERLRWLRDVREEAESAGFSWSIWAYKTNGGWAIARSEQSQEIDPHTLQALGLVDKR